MRPFSKDDFRTLVDRPHALSLSVFLPTERAGKETQQNAIRFKNLLRQAATRIEDSKALRPPEIREFLAPAYRLLEEVPFWQHQEDGLAVFLASDSFSYYRVPQRFDEQVVVNRRFYVKPMLPLLTGDGVFYVLALSRKQVKLYRGSRFGIDEVDLGDTPTSFLDAVGHEIEEQHLQWHTGTAAQAGSRPAQFHGQGGGEDDVKPEIRKFFLTVDRGVREAIPDNDTPLVLAGVESILPIYREASSVSGLDAEEIRHNPLDMSLEELHARAWSVMQPRFQREEQKAVERFRELAGTGRTSDDLGEIVPATQNGRVDTLFVARGAQRWGTFDIDSQRLELQEPPRETSQDLLDLAAVQTLLHSGKVFVVDPDEVPSRSGSVAAVFRY